MANIRIRDLANLASSSASDDFLALDGLANGTRKLDAFSPTFGGNATVGGTLTVNGVGPHAFAGTININPSSGDVQQNFQRAGTGKGILSIPGTAGNIVADSAVDDLVVRTTSGKAFRVTTDGGSTSSLTVTTAAATFAKDILLGTSGPSVPSTLSARAPRQGLVFDGSGSAASFPVVTIGSGNFTASAVVNATNFGAVGRVFIRGLQFEVGIDALGKVYAFNGTTILTSTNAVVVGKNSAVAYVKNGSTGTFYIDGISAGTVTDNLTYSTALEVGGNNATSGWLGTIEAPLLYNRALSAAEVKALYENGVPAAADINSASNTSLITGANSDFSSDTGYWTKGSGATISGGTANLNGGANSNISRGNLTVLGKRYRITVTVVTADAFAYVSDGNVTTLVTGAVAGFGSTGTKTFEVAIPTTAGTGTGLQIVSPSGTLVLDNLLLYPLGAVLAPDATQTGGGLTWYDTSGNGANITLPASGVAWNVPTSGNVTSGGQLNLRAGGTNQLVYIAPSGTGTVRFGGTTTATLLSDSGLNLSIGTASGGAGLHFLSGSQTALFGTTTNSNNGRLQLATHTTSTGGIGFGTDVSLYRESLGSLVISGTSLSYGASGLQVFNTTGSSYGISVMVSGSSYAAGTITGVNSIIQSAYTTPLAIGTNAAQGIKLYTNNTTALTIDASQNATFAGAVTVSGGSFAAATIYKTATLGLVIAGATGSSDDFHLTSPAGQSIMTVPTGTRNVSFSATLTTVGNITSGAAITTSAPVGGAGLWELGIANTVTPTAPNRTITIEIAGVAYYIHAKTTND